MAQYTAFELVKLFKQDFFSNLDYYFARSMARAFNENESIVLVSCALVSKALFKGDICLDIKEESGKTRPVSQTGSDMVKFPDFEAWTDALQNSSMVSVTVKTPLVLDSDYRLYFSKYYDFQNRLIQNIIQRVCQNPLKIDQSEIGKMVETYFPNKDKCFLCQKNSVKNALLNCFTIISGGPGTGKTFITKIFKKIFFLYAEKHNLPEPKIICAAPTGKAASKMEQGSTIHSILKPLKNRPGFYYNKDNLLKTDVLIIDEASMIDISLLTRLLEAVPEKARVILLGDKNQLSSIQAGSVFSDICNAKSLSSLLFVLEYNFRSKGKTGIENLSKAVNENNRHSLEKILISRKYPDVVFEQLNKENPVEIAVKKHIIKGYHSFAAADRVETAINKLDRFKILCAHNSGEYGTLPLNHICEKILRTDNNFDIQEKFFKKIIMVNANDYKKELFNGDTGIIFETENENCVFFKTLDDKTKKFRVTDLPDHDTAFAITIHKSQGSEFDCVLMIIPDRVSPVVTRQLLYTAITRAKKKVIILGDLKIIKTAMSVDLKRNSGITKCLDRSAACCHAY